MLSKIANFIAGSVLMLLIVFLVYRYTDWFKPAADHMISQVKATANHIAPGGPFGEGNSETLLNQAREAYARGDIDASVTAYKDYIKKNPSNPDASGELGNVYYSTGKLQEAAQSYYDAANLLIEQRQNERVFELMPVIGQINPSLANDLSAKLSQASPQGQSSVELAGQEAQQQVPPQSALRHY